MSGSNQPSPLIVPQSNLAVPLQPRGYAMLWRRVLAGWIDLIVLGMLMLAMWGISALIAGQENSSYDYYYRSVEDRAVMILLLYGLPLVLLGYPLLCFSRIGGGGSVGYRTAHIRLIAERTGRAPGLLRTLWWWLGYPLTLAFGWLLYFSEEKRRMLNNMMSGTVVVHVGRVAAPHPLSPHVVSSASAPPRVQCGVCQTLLEPRQNFCRTCGTPTPFRNVNRPPILPAHS